MSRAKRLPFLTGEDYPLRFLCMLAGIPSAGALLAKVYGLAQLRTVFLYLFLPGVIFWLVIWRWAARTGRDYLATGLALGFWGGLLGTLAYDLSRLPFLVLLGRRIFVPINIYGLWLLDADSATRLTDIAGWAYHFSNGIAFGLMYAVLMRRAHWAWAIVWALLLESIAILSPFSAIFNLSGNYGAIGIAYLGHIAYGLPLGLIVQRWDASRAWLERRPLWLRRGWLVAFMAAFSLVYLWPSLSDRDDLSAQRPAAASFIAQGIRLFPDYVRFDRGGTLTIENRDPAALTVVNKTESQNLPLAAQEQIELRFSNPGIYQLFVETSQRTHSSFVIVEPVEDVNR